MKVELKLEEASYNLARALANKKRIRILTILKTKELTNEEVHSRLEVVKYKDTVYRHLEILHKAGLVGKRYDPESKLLMYGLKTNEVCFEI